MLKPTLLALTLILPTLNPVLAKASKASSVKASAVADSGNPFTKERNQAAGNLSTSIVIMQRMGNDCRGKGGLTEDKIKATQQKWIKDNRDFLMMHADYINGYLTSIKQIQGEEAARQAMADMKKTFIEQGNEAVKATIDKNGTDTACSKFFEAMDAGKMDIKSSHPDYKVLKGMLDYSQKNAPKK
ncbi:hypothetical protein [Chitinibacter tainanensis]|uniref:hypothetical protein n=1 Tax=Chitinibacter tainanensis TaxID=230667 RepID=UPI00040C7F4F|nr:hypothetical protein [Chitinibacter tainanensis]